MKKNIIAISREFGSGGRTIGKLVAEKLGIEFYDKDIIKKVAEESGLTRKYVEHYGEFAPSSDQRFAYSFVGLDEDSNSPLVQLWKTREMCIRDRYKAVHLIPSWLIVGIISRITAGRIMDHYHAPKLIEGRTYSGDVCRIS